MDVGTRPPAGRAARRPAARRPRPPGSRSTASTSASVGTLIAAHAATRRRPRWCARSTRETEGNPFFVEEMVRHLIEDGARGSRAAGRSRARGSACPRASRRCSGGRLARLSDAVPRAARQRRGARPRVRLRPARVDVRRRRGGGDRRARGGARGAARVVEPRPGRYAFTHALVRETLYEALSGPRRQRLHARAARDRGRRGARPRGAASPRWRSTCGSRARRPIRPRASSTRCAPASTPAATSPGTRRPVHWDGALALMERAGAPTGPSARGCASRWPRSPRCGRPRGQIAQLGRALALYAGARRRRARGAGALAARPWRTR